jgi:hypothetical protein
MPPYILRLAFMIEFLVALIAIFETWSMVGGQSHLDVMPWWAKLGFTMGLALAIVMATMSAVSHERAWNAKTMACVLLVLMIATGMGATTYYYHLHENDDQAQSTEDDITSLRMPELVP